MPYKVKVCLMCIKDFQPTSGKQRYCHDCADAYTREYKRGYELEHHEPRLAYKKKYYADNRESERARRATSRAAHLERESAYAKEYRLLHPDMAVEMNKRHIAKRRTLGFIPLNSPFVGCEGHHVDNEQVIYMPKTLHRSVWHRQSDGQGMAKINAIAYNYLFKQEVEAATRRPM